MSETPAVTNIRKRNGIAGQMSVTVAVQYPDEDAQDITFIGSEYGPVVMLREGWPQDFVSEPRRFGKFGTKWVEKFFGGQE